MLGFQYIKFDSMTYVIQYKKGKLSREGRGLSFFYFAPNTSISAVPLGTNDVSFIFNETTKDFQEITIQGQITYKIERPKELSETLDFTVDSKGAYKKNDIEKLDQRIINEAQTSASAMAQSLTLKQAIRSLKQFEQQISEGLKNSNVIEMLGLEMLGVNVLSVKPQPEMARALEAETRESVQQEADEATYNRRNFAVEQERKIRESELNTEIAVEEKQKQIAEKKMETQVLKAENQRKLREMNIQADIAVEDQRKSLIELTVENEKKQAESAAYALQQKLDLYKGMDWKTILALQEDGGDPRLNIAIAFREMAENAQKIGNLTISPDLLDSLVQSQK